MTYAGRREVPGPLAASGGIPESQLEDRDTEREGERERERDAVKHLKRTL